MNGTDCVMQEHDLSIFVIMKKLLFILTAILAASCDDGEIIIENLAFTNVTVQACEPRASGSAFSYVFYKLDRTNNESISLALTIPVNLFVEDSSYGPYALNSSNIVEYRKFNGQPADTYFCNSIPSATPTIAEFYVSRGGEVNILTTAETQDDNDGVPAAVELLEGDTDRDGIPNYLDDDDDGDNIPTIVEGFTNDTDGDGILDYLDRDDDGDGILTIQEDLNGDLNPRNDILTAGGLPAYLDNTITIAASPAIDQFRQHRLERSTRVVITIENMTLTAPNKEIVINPYNFGTFVSQVRPVLFTPAFIAF